MDTTDQPPQNDVAHFRFVLDTNDPENIVVDVLPNQPQPSVPTIPSTPFEHCENTSQPDGMTAMGTMHDNPHMPPEEELTGSPADIVSDILSTYQVGGRTDSGLVSKLMKLQAQLEDAPAEPSGMAIAGLGENKKRRLN